MGYLDPSNKGVNARARVKQAPPPADSGGVATAAPSVATEAAASAAGVDRELDEFVGAARDQEADQRQHEGHRHRMVDRRERYEQPDRRQSDVDEHAGGHELRRE